MEYFSFLPRSLQKNFRSTLQPLKKSATIIEYLRGTFYSLPVQLLFLHFRKYQVLLIFWIALMQISGFHKVQRVDIVDEKSSLIYFQTDHLHITNKDDAPMHIDGDPVESVHELEFKLVHDCFRLVQ